MPSGFIVLPDGRCFAVRWAMHDVVLRAIMEQVSEAPLRRWLSEQLPGPEDEQELGYGAWFRKSDQTSITRWIDVRLMTEENQQLFCQAIKRAAAVDHDTEWLNNCLSEFADMVACMERGEPPLSKSHWREVLPPEKKQIGPGWPTG